MSRSLQNLLVVSDMDGTLLTEGDKRLLSSNLETIRLFTSLGGHFTVATGRVHDSVAKYPELIELIGPAITSGGGVIYDFKRNEALLSKQLPRMSAHQALKDALKNFPRVGVLVVGADAHFYQVAPSAEANGLFEDENLTYFVRSSDDLPREWNKLLFAGPPEIMEDVLNFFNQRTYPGAFFVATERRYVEMMPQGVSKGSALKELCALMNHPIEHTIAIGDYFNDLEIMEQAGHSVAMHNAPIEVKMKADEVIGSCDSGGVGHYLYKLIREYD